MSRVPSIFEQAHRLGWIPNLSTLSGQPQQGIRDWLATGNYSFLKAPASKKFEIFVPDGVAVLQSFAYDANRMSCAAFESIASVAPVETMRRSLAWLAVKLYYAAFYSAHAFLRLQGTSCTQLDNRESSRLSGVAQAYGFPAGQAISSGFHSIAFDPGRREMVFANVGGSGGSHEILWFEFDKGVTRLRDAVLQSSLLVADQTAVIAKLKQAQKILSNANSQNGNWPSKMRNDINYRHSFGVWFPYATANNVDRCMSLIRQFLTSDPSENELDEGEEMESFFRICLFIVNLTRVTVIDMASLQAGEESFQHAGPMVVLRRARLIR